MRDVDLVLQQTASDLASHRDALVDAWVAAVVDVWPAPQGEIREYCSRSVDSLLRRLSRGEIAELLRDEALGAAESARAGASFQPLAAATRLLVGCCLPFLEKQPLDREALVRSLTALGELSVRRLEVLLSAQEEESARRLVEIQEQAAQTAERAREVAHSNEDLRRAQAQSQHRAEQIEMMSSVAHEIAPILDPDRLLQVAAETIQARMGHTYVAVVVVDEDGILIGRWAGRPGVGRRSAGRAQGPARGIIGRALRRAAPQVVGDVAQDPDYLADVAGTASEMVIPLLEGGVALGAIDFQSEKPAAFDLDDVAAGEIVAEFLIIALRNARLFAAAREQGPAPSSP